MKTCDDRNTHSRIDAYRSITYLFSSQDSFKYCYPPLPDDDFQTPICENGPIASEDETESKDGESEVKDALESSFNSSEVAVKPKKVCINPSLKFTSTTRQVFEGAVKDAGAMSILSLTGRNLSSAYFNMCFLW